MASPPMRALTPDAIARATSELIFALQVAFPEAELVPCDAIEGEAIHFEVRVPADTLDADEAEEQAIEIKQAIEDRYGLFILVRVTPRKAA